MRSPEVLWARSRIQSAVGMKRHASLIDGLAEGSSTLNHALDGREETNRPSIAKPWALWVNDLYTRESKVLEHPTHGRYVGCPVIGVVVVEGIAGEVDHRRLPAMKVVHLRLDDEQFIAHRGSDSKPSHRVLKVVEHAQKENHIERSDLFWCDLHSVDVKRFYLGVQGLVNQIEAGFGTPARSAPTKVVGSEHTLCAVFFGLKGEKTIPSTDVQHAFSFEVLRKAYLTQLVH